MPGMGQRGFRCEQRRVAKLNIKIYFSATLRINSLGIILSTALQRSRAGAQKQCWSAGNGSADSLQNADAPTAFESERRCGLALSVYETGFQTNDRRSFEEFVG